VIIPALPALDARLVAEHRAAHLGLRAALASAAPEVIRLHRLLQHRLLVESLGQVQPVRPGVDEPLLLPAPRAFLSPTAEARIAGAEAALRYIAGRVDVVWQHRSSSVLQHASPYVLHSCFEASMPAAVDHGAGLSRLCEMSLPGRSTPAPLPRAADCERLLDLVVGVAGEAAAPAVARAGWLAFMVLTIHPFLDGNGRVCRALHLAVQAEDAAVGLDAGITEQWGLNPSGYIAAIDAGWSTPWWDPAQIDALPFMTFAAQASVAGAVLSRRRQRVLADLVDVAVHRGLSTKSAELVVGTALLRVATPAELSPLVPDADPRHRIECVIDEGWLQWATRPASRRTAASSDSVGLVLSPRARQLFV
jgi:hypothetical protein